MCTVQSSTQALLGTRCTGIKIFSCCRLHGKDCHSVEGVIGQGILTSQIQVLQHVCGLRHSSIMQNKITTA